MSSSNSVNSSSNGIIDLRTPPSSPSSSSPAASSSSYSHLASPVPPREMTSRRARSTKVSLRDYTDTQINRMANEDDEYEEGDRAAGVSSGGEYLFLMLHVKFICHLFIYLINIRLYIFTWSYIDNINVVYDEDDDREDEDEDDRDDEGEDEDDDDDDDERSYDRGNDGENNRVNRGKGGKVKSTATEHLSIPPKRTSITSKSITLNVNSAVCSIKAFFVNFSLVHGYFY